MFFKRFDDTGRYIKSIGRKCILYKVLLSAVIATGSGKLFEENSYIKLLDSDNDVLRCVGCIEPNILINPRLEVYPCCSQVIENTILQMGNLNENSLKEIITDIKSNYVLNTVFTEGFTPFIKLLEDNKIDYPHKLASPCEFCEFLFKDDWFLQLLASVNYYENIRK